jgi:serine/threonine protein kinase
MNQDDRLGPYRLIRRLGEGGMGVVHLAVDPQGRQVAVKVLRSEVTGDDVARRRLSREVETMRRVRSPHIAEVVDADVTGSRPYIVTRYVPGRPIDEIVKQDGPLSEEALVRVAYGVAEALVAVHAAGVIHRDLKPGNVLMMDGDPVLIDFGIAQAVDATRLTQTGMFIGTPGYLAPEIIEGHEAGPEIDIHAWAGTLLFAATGQPPFGKGTLEMIFFNITAGKANVDAAPQVLRPILRSALNRDPAARPTASELARRTAQLLPATPRPRPRVPDEITTVPELDTPKFPGTVRSEPRPLPGAPSGVPTGSSGSAPVIPPIPIPSANPQQPQRQTPTATPHLPPPPIPRPAPAEEFVSLLGESPPAPGDPWPTVRVTGQDIRSAGMLPGGAPPGTGADQRRDDPPGPSQEGDIPTRRVRPGELADLVKGGPQQPAQPQPGRPWSGQQPMHQPGQHPGQQPMQEPVQPLPGASHQPPYHPQGHGPGGNLGSHQQPQPASGQHGPGHVAPHQQAQHQPYPPRQPEPVGGSQGFSEMAADSIYDKTPHRRQVNPVMPTLNVPPPQPPFPGTAPGQLLGRSRAYGLVSMLALLTMAALAVRVPVVALNITVPAVVLLRAADIAQPQLNARRPVGAAAGDVFRVLGQPAALVKSAGITVALVPYALILGLPVTLLLTVLVGRMTTANALSWGTAVALWTICAGPGVEGPGRQMRRMLASALPTRSAAMMVAWALGAVATVAVLLALATIALRSQTTWQPFDILGLIDRLDDLRQKAQSP